MSLSLYGVSRSKFKLLTLSLTYDFNLDKFSIFSNEYFLIYSTFIFALERSSSTISALIDESSFEISFIFIFIKSEKITDIDKSEYINEKYIFFS